MLRTRQTRLAIGIRHGRQVATNEFKVRAELNVIGSHFEHAQMEIGDGRKGTASHEQQRSLLRVVHLALEAKLGEDVVVHRSRRDVCGRLVDIVTLPADHFRRHGHRRRAVREAGGIVLGRKCNGDGLSTVGGYDVDFMSRGVGARRFGGDSLGKRG